MAKSDYTGTTTPDQGWYVAAQYMDDTSNRLVVDFARPLQVGSKTSEDDKTLYPLEFKMKVPEDTDAETLTLVVPEYEILMNYGVWPDGESIDIAYV